MKLVSPWFFKGRLPQRRAWWGPGILASGSNSPSARSGYKCLRHKIGGAA
jgi:hypothetical protein